MRPRAVLPAALAVFLALPAMADSGLKRLTLRQDSLGWEAVGRLDLGDRGFCTGVLVAPDIVLTAAHCLVDERTGERLDPAEIMFRAGLRDGESIAERRSQRAVLHPAYKLDDSDGWRQMTADVALLELADPIPAAVAAPFSTSDAVGTGGTVSLVSYARGRDRALSWQKDCSVLARGQGGMIFSCDADFGSSGAPVFETSSGRPRIVSLVSRGSREGSDTQVFGAEIEAPLSEVRHALRVGDGVWPKTTFDSRRLNPDAGAWEGGDRDIGARFVKP